MIDSVELMEESRLSQAVMSLNLLHWWLLDR